MENLFESAVLLVVGISKVEPTEEEKIQAAVLALPLKGTVEAQPGQQASIVRPQKRLRGELASTEVQDATMNVAAIVARLAGSSTSTTQAERFKKKRRRLQKVSGRGSHRGAEPTRVEEVGTAAAATPVPTPKAGHLSAPAPDILLTESVDVVILEESPARLEGGEVGAREPVEAEAGPHKSVEAEVRAEEEFPASFHQVGPSTGQGASQGTDTGRNSFTP